MASGEASENTPAQMEAAVEVATAKPVVDESVPLVLVSGASGYIATHTIQQLLISGNYRVRGTVRSLKNEEKVKPLQELVPDAKYPLELCEADLQDKDSWIPAVKGCKYVLHIASPFPASVPKNPEDVIRPAVDGTVNVLSACSESGTVKRVVLTSSIAAVSCGLVGHPGRSDNTYSEEDWSPPEGCAPYERSKTLAEKAAWDFIKDLPEEKKFELAVINPGGVFGPIITKSSVGTTAGMIKSMLSGQVPGVVDIYSGLVDVRDVAQAHIIAMEKPECNGKRYLLVSESNVPFLTIAQIVNKEFGPQGYKTGTMKIPKFFAWIYSKFNSDMNMIYPSIGKRVTYINDRMINELGIQPRSTEQSIVDTGYSLIEFGVVRKTPQYHGPGGKPEAKQADDKKDDTQLATEGPPSDDQAKETTDESQKDDQMNSEEVKGAKDETQKLEQTKTEDIEETTDKSQQSKDGTDPQEEPKSEV